jgi:hypothetical protein
MVRVRAIQWQDNANRLSKKPIAYAGVRRGIVRIAIRQAPSKTKPQQLKKLLGFPFELVARARSFENFRQR